MHHGRYGCYRIGRRKNGCYQFAYCNRYCIESSSFVCNNLSAGSSYVLQHSIFVDLGYVLAHFFYSLVVLVQADTGNVSAAPRNEGSIAVLTEYVSVDVFLGNVEVFRQSAAKSCGIQHGTGTKDLVFRKSGDLCKHVGHDINRVAYNDVDGIRSRFYDFRCDGF